MQTLRPALAGLLVALYGALACGMAGGIVTFWMWGFGAIVTLPLGFVWGAALGCKWPLRDATILFAGCFGALAAANWIGFALDWGPPVDLAVPIGLIFLSGLLSWVAQSQLSPAARYRLALALVASLLVNVVMVKAIRS